MPNLTAERPSTAAFSPLVWRVFIGLAFSSVGSGLTLPFLYIYLTEVRDLRPAVVGLVLAWMGVVSLALTGLVGTLMDRIGPRVVLMAGLAVEAAGMLAWSRVTSAAEAFAVGAVVSAGAAALWPGSQALLTRMVEPSQRERVYGVWFMLLNAGLGVGGLVASTIVSIDSVASFQRLYEIDAVTYVAYIAALATLPRLTGLIPEGARDDEVDVVPQGGWREVFRDRTFVRFVVLMIFVLTFGYAQFEAGFTAFSVTVAHIEPHYLGWAFAANTAAIVAGQMLSLRLIEGRARSRMLALSSAVWASSWVVVGLAGVVPGWWSVAMVVAGLGVFGIGETLWAPVWPAVVNALATEELRGRYNAMGTVAWSVSGIIGPAVAGLLFGAGLSGPWLAMVLGGTTLSALLFLRLGRHLTPEQNGLVTD